jgi:hypothetical protein
MMRKIVPTVVALGILGACISPGTALAVKISPNDDTYIDQVNPNRVSDAPSLAAAGLYMKYSTGQNRAVFMEYTIPSVAATTATFNATYFRAQKVGVTTGAWTMQVAGSTTPASFDESTLTFNIAKAAGGIDTYTYSPLGTAALPGGNGTGTTSQQQDVVPNIPISMDITAYFNAHLGETITFKLNSLTNGDYGGSLQDREQSRVMTSTNVAGQIPDAPFIEYVPEPAAGLLLLAAMPLLRRRTK